MKKLVSLILTLTMCLSLLPCRAEEPLTVTGTVTEIERYGHALLDITIEDFLAAGFDLGDIVTVTAGSFEGSMPFLNGYYVAHGETMLRAYPGHTNIAVCINYGRFADAAGIDAGDEVTITLTEKAGALTLQEINSLVYDDDPAQYDSDAAYANFREVTVGAILPGRLYRSASPIDNSRGRAAVANTLMEAAAVRTVVNLANTDEEILAFAEAEGFASEEYMAIYEEGGVIALGMPINYTSDEFGAGIARGVAFMAVNDGPYLVHCQEGKDRAGFFTMLLEALCGATEEEIVEDYLLSYRNYYRLDPVADAEKLDAIKQRDILPMLRFIAGVEDGESLEDVDLAAAAEEYLLGLGLTEEEIAAVQDHLTE